MRSSNSLSPIPVLILVLLAAVTVQAETPRPQPTQSANTQTQVNNGSPTSGPTIATLPRPSSKTAADQRKTYTYQYYYYPKNGGDWPGVLQAIATLGLLFLAGLQMRHIRKSAEATAQAAEAAKENSLAAKEIAQASAQSVEIAKKNFRAMRLAAFATEKSVEVAQLALRAERPYLFIEEQSVHSSPIAKSFRSLEELLTGKFERPDITRDPLSQKDKYKGAGLQISFVLFNRGRGISIIDRIKIKTLVGHGMIKDGKKKMATGGRFEVTVATQMLRPDRGAKFFAPSIQLPLDVFADIVGLKKGLLILLLIQYHDVYRHTFATIHPLAYHPPVRRHDDTIIDPENLVPQRHDRPRYL